MVVPRPESTDKDSSPQALRPHSPPIPQSGSGTSGSGTWRKSSRSGPNEDCCEVRLGRLPHVGFRDSHHPDSTILDFTPNEWWAFLGPHLAR
ncbi:DUF397 domain-containing protein [Nocardiopsis sp. JB363]|uniref:DUF397 domain-containing protein n=1 Tax=Nocardiopsis sp. JB363 TaxID=1434837 RepID=UPI000B35D621